MVVEDVVLPFDARIAFVIPSPPITRKNDSRNGVIFGRGQASWNVVVKVVCEDMRRQSAFVSYEESSQKSIVEEGRGPDNIAGISTGHFGLNKHTIQLFEWFIIVKIIR